MKKNQLTERDICIKFVTPSLMAAGWDLNAQIREEVSFTDGRIYVRGKLHSRGKRKRARKITVNGVEVTIIHERVHYMGDDGRIITESLRDYTRRNIRAAYASLNDFLTSWKQSDKKRAIVEEQQGVLFVALNDEIGSAFDPFDLICHVAFKQKPLTRKERTDQVKKRDYFTKYGELARRVISALLDKYSDMGLLDLENPEIIRGDPLNKLGTPTEIIRAFDGRSAYDAAIHALTDELYKAA